MNRKNNFGNFSPIVKNQRQFLLSALPKQQAEKLVPEGISEIGKWAKISNRDAFPKSGMKRKLVPDAFLKPGMGKKLVPGRSPKPGMDEKLVPGRSPETGWAKISTGRLSRTGMGRKISTGRLGENGGKGKI